MSYLTERTALIVGATGLIGQQLLKKLLDSPYYTRVIVLARRPTGIMNSKMVEHIYDFENPDARLVRGEDVFCCLGTTIKKAGSKEAFRKVDLEYPLQIARFAQQNGAQKFLIVTAMGANPDSSIFYNQIKGKVEQRLQELQYEILHIFQPSLLLGERTERRVGERIGTIFANILNPFMVGSLRKFRAIDSNKVASAMIANAKESKKGVFIHHSDELQKYL
tara:strand:+ start:340 stop:1002 length:663 start_codon:yes stop_codon:yes gene_type:complete